MRPKVTSYKRISRSYYTNLGGDRSRSKGRWHSACASHSKRSQHNPSALSKYIPHEESMSHLQRKSYVLPSRRTIGESWGALRRSWLGFKIAVGNGDRSLMKHYASFIVKVQAEMGIRITKFDSDLLDEKAAEIVDDNELVQGNNGSGNDVQENMNYDSKVKERELDYDDLLGKDLMEQDNRPVSSSSPAPRKSIFATFHSRIENSCPQPDQSRISKHTINYRTSCPVGPSESPDLGAIAIIKRVEHDYSKSCYIQTEYQANEQNDVGLYIGDYLQNEEEEEEELIQDEAKGYAEGYAEAEIDNNSTSDEPSQWADDSNDFQTTEETDADHVVHEDNSCPFRETRKRNRSCPYKSDNP